MEAVIINIWYIDLSSSDATRVLYVSTDRVCDFIYTHVFM